MEQPVEKIRSKQSPREAGAVLTFRECTMMRGRWDLNP